MIIPHSIKSSILEQWLEGLSRDEIGLRNGISLGSVSTIIQECRSTVYDLDLMRELAVNLKKTGLSNIDLSSSFRLYNKILILGIDLKTAESILEKIHVHCYVNNLDVQHLFSLVIKQIQQVEDIGIPVSEFETLYNEKVNGLLELDYECKEIRGKKMPWLSFIERT